jgi:hypothetical protein
VAFLASLLGDKFDRLSSTDKKATYDLFAAWLIGDTANNDEVPKLVQEALNGSEQARKDLRPLAQAKANELLP